jgi:hypothetical protein
MIINNPACSKKVRNVQTKCGGGDCFAKRQKQKESENHLDDQGKAGWGGERERKRESFEAKEQINQFSE